MDEDTKKILDELREIKALIKQDLELDMKDLNLDTDEVILEQDIKEEAVKIDENTKGFAQNLTGLKYVSLDAWHRTVWINCEYRKAKEETREIDYSCKLYGGPCRFEVCPKNIGTTKKQ
jgi:hypothetical protein